MANRRMLSNQIIDSDEFLDMPHSTQNLYFHLNMKGDDDGFVNSWKRIMRTIGVSDDDMRILLAKKFVILFDSGVIVIKHWKMHNYIQKDRYRPSSYIEEKEMLELKSNNSYTLKKSMQSHIQEQFNVNGYDVSNMDTESIQPVRVGKVSQGKIRLGEVSQGKVISNAKVKPPTPMRDSLANYYQNAFLSMRSGSAWGNFAKERKNLNDLANKTRNLLAETQTGMTETEMADTLIAELQNKKQYGKNEYWKGVTLTPSGLIGRWSQIVDSASNRLQQSIEHSIVIDFEPDFGEGF